VQKIIGGGDPFNLKPAGWVSYGHKWKTGTEKQYFTDIIGLSSTIVT